MFQKSFITLLFCVLLLTCDSEKKQVSFKTLEFDKKYMADISVLYDFAEGNTMRSKSINNNVEQAIIQTIGLDSASQDLSSVLDRFDKQYVTFKSDFPDSSLPKWELQVETEQTYQSDDVITIAISVYQYQGGAHGNSQIQLLNLDAKTGNKLSIEDIITDLKGFEALAKTYFIKNLNQKDETLKMEDYFFGEPFHLPENIGFSEDGFLLLYNVYEVASYAQGYTEFAIPFEEMDSFLKLF